MKKFLWMLILAVVFFSCDESLEDGFEDSNEDVIEKYLSMVEISQGDDSETIEFNYDISDRISTIIFSDNDAYYNESTTYRFNYQEFELKSVVQEGDEESFDIAEELYQNPHSAYKVGQVLDYDDNGNPILLETEDNNIDDIRMVYLTYDTNPNPYFYTMKAGGIIGVLDKVSLNFGIGGSSLIKAKQLLPFNNITSQIQKDLEGRVEATATFDYIYSDDKYPQRLIISSTSSNRTETTYIKYYYK